MPITASSIIEDLVQEDGRRSIREQHRDHLGHEIFVSYLAEPGDDVNAILSIRAQQISDLLAERELEQNEQEAMGEL